jgi:dihydrofolate reductase
MILSFVVAAAENNVIGNNNQLLWNLPNDLKFFKNKTWAMPVVMGRKTFESLGNKALNGRLNLILTTQKDYKKEGTITVSSIQEAIEISAQKEYKELMICGGGEIYKSTIGIADKIHITRVHASFEGDTFFPEIDITKWQLISDELFRKDEKHAYDYSFQLWERIK